MSSAPTRRGAGRDAHDPQLGPPLCLDCYHHDHQVVWNAFSGEPWRRFRRPLPRRAATSDGTPRVHAG
ncbi:replication initiator [Micromonospora echinospora]|uniref:replication initiator n=1 Tax=Micromonospora echinospora TaxID=1877 RepID=UPI0037B3F591